MLRLDGLKLLVTEDEFLVAMSLEDMLRGFGCEVLGPFARVDDAKPPALAAEIDGAVLDINLRGETVYPVADLLVERGVPFIFCSGYADLSALPDRFDRVLRLGKPYGEKSLKQVMEKAFRPGACGMDDLGRAAV